MNTIYRFLALIIFLFNVPLVSKGYDPLLWWQVEIRITVTGEYARQIERSGFEGNYSFTAVILGTMEDDDDEDFIFVQAHQQQSGMKWTETVYNKNQKKQFNLDEKVKTETNLNYVFGRDGILSFDIGIKPITVPFKNEWISKNKKLYLPESAGDEFIVNKSHYNKRITSGSNRVAVTVEEMYSKKEINRIFKWEWQEKERNSTWTNKHKVKVELKIIPLKRQE
jgi:hypothetical protein